MVGVLIKFASVDRLIVERRMEGGIRDSYLGMEVELIGAKFRLWAMTRDFTTEVLNFSLYEPNVVEADFECVA